MGNYLSININRDSYPCSVMIIQVITKLEPKTINKNHQIIKIWVRMNYVTQICELRLHFKMELESRTFEYT